MTTLGPFGDGKQRRLAPLLLVSLVAALAACDGTDSGAGGGPMMSSTSTGIDASICDPFCIVEFWNSSCPMDISSCPQACRRQVENVGVCADKLVAVLDCHAKMDAETHGCYSDSYRCAPRRAGRGVTQRWLCGGGAGPPPCDQKTQVFAT